MIVPATYSFIESIQVSFDGNWVYFVAPIGNGNPALYKVPITGGTPIVLDNSGYIYSVNVDVVDGSMATYDKRITNSSGANVSAIFSLSTSGSGSPTLLADDSSHNYEFPQFSKDATQIVFESDRDDPNFEIYVMSATGGSFNGSGLTQVTNLPDVAKQDGVSFSADGKSTVFVGSGPTPSQTGVYHSGLIGSSPPENCTLIVHDSTIQAGLYWTSVGGRSQGGTTGYLSRRRQ